MRRIQRVEALLKKELANLIEETVGDRLGIVTIIGVFVQEDLKEAKIYVSCLEKSSGKQVINLLNKKSKEYQQIIGKRLHMKFTPRLFFQEDKGLENVEKVNQLLYEINQNEGKK